MLLDFKVYLVTEKRRFSRQLIGEMYPQVMQWADRVVLKISGVGTASQSRFSVSCCLEKSQAVSNPCFRAPYFQVKILFRRAPPIYRASVAAELTLEATKVPHIHVGTWQPLLKRRAGVTIGGSGHTDNTGGISGGSVIGIGYGGEEREDVRETMARAQRFLNGFRSVGVRVNVLSMETVTLPRNAKSTYAGTFDGRPSSFHQAIRLWFSFPDERTVSLKRQSEVEKLGLIHVDVKGVGTLGSWVIVTAQDASPCAEAGVPVGENVLLTHVNGFDVSPMAYRSLAPLPFGEGDGWATAVLPALVGGDSDTITLTFV